MATESVATQQNGNAKTIPIIITKTIANEYQRRDAFRELRPGQRWFVKTFSNGDLYHIADYKLAFRVLDDAWEQHQFSRGQHGAGITRAYGSLARCTLNFLRSIIGFDPADIGRMALFTCCTDLGTVARAPVDALFGRLGIPCPDTQNTLPR